MSDRRYDVTAMSFPIVYTVDGAPDRNGLIYTLRRYVPILQWAREQWEADDEWLPGAHHRRQRIQMLLDALWRYEQMVDRLRTGPQQSCGLLSYLGGLGGGEGGL